MNKKLLILIGAALLFAGAIAFLKYGASGADTAWNVSDGGKWLFPLITVAAVLDSVNPCALSILLLTIGFLFSLGIARSGIIRVGGAYIAGIFVVYLLIGLGIIQALHLFDTPHFMAKAGASLIIVAGLINIVNEFFPVFPLKLRIPRAAHGKIAKLMEKSSIPAAFFLGAFVGLCEFPCTGGPYLMALGLLHDQATYLQGVGYLVFYNLVFILPLVLILLFAGDKNLLEKVKEWKNKENKNMRLWGGIAMVALGLLIFAF